MISLDYQYSLPRNKAIARKSLIFTLYQAFCPYRGSARRHGRKKMQKKTFLSILSVVLILFGVLLLIAAPFLQRAPKEDALHIVSGNLTDASKEEITLGEKSYRFASYADRSGFDAAALSRTAGPGEEVLLYLDDTDAIVAVSAAGMDFLGYDNAVRKVALRQIFRLALGLVLLIAAVIILTVGKIGPFRMREKNYR